MRRSTPPETAFKALSAISLVTAVHDVWRAFNPPGTPGSPWLGMMLVLAVFAAGHLVVAALAFAAAAYARAADVGRRRAVILVAAALFCGTFQLLGIVVALLASF